MCLRARERERETEKECVAAQAPSQVVDKRADRYNKGKRKREGEREREIEREREREGERGGVMPTRINLSDKKNQKCISDGELST